MSNLIPRNTFAVLGLSFCLAFFFCIEWRWQLLLLGLPDFKPHVIAAGISAVVVLIDFLRSKKRDCAYWIIYMLIIYCISISVLNLDLFYGNSTDNISKELGAWYINLALFITASDENIWEYIKKHYRVLLVAYTLLIVPLFILLFYSGEVLSSHFNLRNAIWISGIRENSVHGVSYQSIGDKIALIAFILLSFTTKRTIKAFIVTTAFASLYIAGSKASMVGYIFACASYYIISLLLNKHYIKGFFLLFAGTSILLCCLFYITHDVSMQSSDNWLIQAVAHGKSDASVSSRRAIEKENQKTRDERILLGNYKFDYRLGRSGSYTHSALGIIDYYGVFIFIISVGLWCYLLFKLLTFGGRNIPIAKATLMSMLFYSLLFIIARFPPINYLTYWVLGMAVFTISHRSSSLHMSL